MNDQREIIYKKRNKILDSESIHEMVLETFRHHIEDLVKNEFEKVITLQVLDRYWMEHINTMSHLREGIHLRGYAQEDPLRAYTMEGYDLFDQMLQRIDKDVSITLIKAEIRQNIERKEKQKKNYKQTIQIKKIQNTTKKSKKIGRNDPCPCGSGKKYKQCHGK